ncbi:MAG TPA: hypothetical protein VI728_05045 [Syntrophales bacterium]|nr:hypothetical protein [Syntrophales bacterium]
MGYQIVFVWSEESAVELESMGFKKQEVYMKEDSGGPTVEANKKGDAEFFSMKHKPYQFITTSYWGAGAD